MRCPLLLGRQIKKCGAFKADILLNLEELENKCTTPLFFSCKAYQKYMQEGIKLSLKEYGTSQHLINP